MIYYIDLILTCLFILEIILKMLAYGILLNGPNSYLRNPWNIIDVIIISTSVIVFFNFIVVVSDSSKCGLKHI